MRHCSQLISPALIVVTAFLSCTMFAQPQGDRGMGGRQMMSLEDQLEFWQEELQLSEEQVSELKPILEEAREEMMKIRERYRGQGRQGMGQARQEIDKLNEETQARLEPILSEEQMARYKEIRKERVEQMRRRSPRGGN